MSPDGRIHFSAVTGEYRITGSDDDRLVITGTLGTDVREFSIDGDETSWRIELHPIQSNRGRMPRRPQLAPDHPVPRGAEVEATTVSGEPRGRQISPAARSPCSRSAARSGLNGWCRNGCQCRPSAENSAWMTADARQPAALDQRQYRGRNLAGRVNVNSVSGGIKLDGAMWKSRISRRSRDAWSST
jgi:hypothetical protein